MIDVEYVREKLKVAADAVRAQGPIRERLLNSWISAGVVLGPNDFPPEQQPRFEAIRTALSTHDGPEGKIRASLDAMDDETAKRIGDEIVVLAASARAWR